MNPQHCKLIVRGIFSGKRTQLELPGNWEQVNHWKRLHECWAIVTPINGYDVILAQSITFHDAPVWDVMIGLA